MERRIGTTTIEVMGVTVTVKDAVYYPYVPATQIDPPESAFAEWGAVYIDKTDVSPLFEYKANADRLEEALILSLEDE